MPEAQQHGQGRTAKPTRHSPILVKRSAPINVVVERSETGANFMRLGERSGSDCSESAPKIS